MGLWFFGLTVSLVLGSRYVIPSDSHAGESSGFLIVSKRCQKGVIQGFNVTSIISSASSSKLGLFQLTSIYGVI